MVGLPARGKTYVSHKLTNYLNWLGYCAKTFNVGEYRRKCAGPDVPHDFFSSENEEGNEARKLAASLALADLVTWVHSEDHHVPHGRRKAAQDDCHSSASPVPSSGSSGRSLTPGNEALGSIIYSHIEAAHNKVAIFDATNTTKERRAWILQSLLKEGINLSEILFIEIMCDVQEIIDSNVLMVKMSSPDYLHAFDKEKAIQDFKLRIKHYEDQYEPICADEFDELLDANGYSTPRELSVANRLPVGVPVIKVININEQINMRNCHEYWQSRIAYYLMNTHIAPRTIYICRHGESELNVAGKIGGDSDLSPRGQVFATLLPQWINTNFGKDKSLTVWTSTLKRTIQTAKHLHYPKLCWKALDEIDAGSCEGLSYSEIAEKLPADFAARDKDKYHYRYPEGGESYADLVLRLEPIMMALERQTDILLIGHQAVLRAIYSYFVGIPREQLPYVKIPLHTIIELRPKAYGCDVIHHDVGIPAVDTQRDKPS